MKPMKQLGREIAERLLIPPKEPDYVSEGEYRRALKAHEAKIERAAHTITQHISKARAETRRQTIEECRGIALNEFPEGTKWKGAYKSAGRMIATKIGALLPKRKQEEDDGESED